MTERGHIFTEEAAGRISRSTRRTERIRGATGKGDAIAFPDRTRRRAQDTPAAVPREFVVVSESDDALVCNLFDPFAESQGTAEYIIAKPYALRRTPFDGATVPYPTQSVVYEYTAANARTATSGETVEEQDITPAYFAGDRIVAIPFPTGFAVEGTPVEWIDTNQAARAWAAEAEA